MTAHITAKPGEIAERILLPGDPLRAKYIAETYFENPKQFNEVRNMFGYTGTYKGKELSVMGTGMGIPSMSIYANELFREYGVKRAIRIGTAGTIQKNVEIRDIVIALSTCTDSGANKIRFGGRDFAPAATFSLVKRAYEYAESRDWKVKTGNIVTTDMFYSADPDEWKIWAEYGVLAIEMESSELYTLAAKYGREVLSIISISDSLISKEAISAEERQLSFTRMMEIALETVIS